MTDIETNNNGTTGETNNNQNNDVSELMEQITRLKEENEKLKRATSSASSDAAKFKRELQSKMSDAEKEKAEREENFAKMEEELKTLRRSRDISDHKAKLLSIGYSEDLAQKSAEAVVDGDMSAVFGGFTAFIEAHDKAVKAEMLKNTPSPVKGSGNSAVTKEQFSNMSYRERSALFDSDPELYKKLNE